MGILNLNSGLISAVIQALLLSLPSYPPDTPKPRIRTPTFPSACTDKKINSWI